MFLTRAKLETFTASRLRLLEELVYLSASGYIFEIPKGFVCDLASVPRLLRFLYSVNGDHRESAILHDFLYDREGLIDDESFTREQCDDLFYEAMINSGVSEWKAWSMWAGVRIGGWVAWNK